MYVSEHKKQTLTSPLSSVEQNTALPSFRGRETFSLSSTPLFASREGAELPRGNRHTSKPRKHDDEEV